MAIFHIFNELKIASHSFAMTERPFFIGLIGFTVFAGFESC